MYGFELGDYVYGEDWCYGQIIKLEEDGVWVEFDTGDDWATWVFDYDQIRHFRCPHAESCESFPACSDLCWITGGDERNMETLC